MAYIYVGIQKREHRMVFNPSGAVIGFGAFRQSLKLRLRTAATGNQPILAT